MDTECQPARSPAHVSLDAHVLLELLSERLLADFPADVWREVFVGPASGTVRFESRVVTFLSVAGLLPEWTRAGLVRCARRHGGHVESFGAPAAFGFDDARQALKAALQLQAESAHSLRMALLTAPCVMASFRIDGCEQDLSLGVEARVAADRAGRAPAGSVQVGGETYPLIARTLERQQHGGIVCREIHDGVVTSALITFPPPHGAASSTFAGLGLTPEGGR